MMWSAAANPASTSPTSHSSVTSPSVGRVPRSTSDQSTLVHVTSFSSRPSSVFPSRRAFAPPGRRLSSGSSANGSGSRSICTCSIASAAASSVTAAIAKIGSPSYSGSLVSICSPGASTAGRSSAVRIASTPGIASAARVSRFRTRPCGIGLSSSFVNSMPSARKSSAYFARPVTFATRSGVE